MQKLYPESIVETKGFTAKYYDALMDIITFGRYHLFIEKSIELMRIRPPDRILDLGTGTGRNACLMAKFLSKKGKLFLEMSMLFDIITPQKMQFSCRIT